MTDRELLELAAKAAGVYARISWTNSSGQPQMFNAPFDFVRKHGADDLPVIWNPLTDDGDALRLAVKLNMGISIPVFHKPRADVICFRDSGVNVIEKSNDPYAATRRAIVRAAAEIGKATEDQR